jgi:hypothetical protein
MSAVNGLENISRGKASVRLHTMTSAMERSQLPAHTSPRHHRALASRLGRSGGRSRDSGAAGHRLRQGGDQRLLSFFLAGRIVASAIPSTPMSRLNVTLWITL